MKFKERLKAARRAYRDFDQPKLCDEELQKIRVDLVLNYAKLMELGLDKKESQIKLIALMLDLNPNSADQIAVISRLFAMAIKKNYEGLDENLKSEFLGQVSEYYSALEKYIGKLECPEVQKTDD